MADIDRVELDVGIQTIPSTYSSHQFQALREGVNQIQFILYSGMPSALGKKTWTFLRLTDYSKIETWKNNMFEAI